MSVKYEEQNPFHHCGPTPLWNSSSWESDWGDAWGLCCWTATSHRKPRSRLRTRCVCPDPPPEEFVQNQGIPAQVPRLHPGWWGRAEVPAGGSAPPTAAPAERHRPASGTARALHPASASCAFCLWLTLCLAVESSGIFPPTQHLHVSLSFTAVN